MQRKLAQQEEKLREAKKKQRGRRRRKSHSAAGAGAGVASSDSGDSTSDSEPEAEGLSRKQTKVQQNFLKTKEIFKNKRERKQRKAKRKSTHESEEEDKFEEGHVSSVNEDEESSAAEDNNGDDGDENKDEEDDPNPEYTAELREIALKDHLKKMYLKNKKLHQLKIAKVWILNTFMSAEGDLDFDQAAKVLKYYDIDMNDGTYHSKQSGFPSTARISEAMATAMLEDFDIAAWTIEKKRKRT